MPQLSIVTPVFNIGNPLEAGINAIRKQSYSEFELIVVDDGSTDNSSAICDELASKDPRIIVIHKVNGGSGSARNIGTAVTKYEYIAFPDSDDLCKQDMYQIMMDHIFQTGADLVICSYENIRTDERDRILKQEPQVLFDCMAKSPDECRKLWFKIRKINISLLNTPWNKIYRKSIIEKYHISFPDIKRAQDAVFNLMYYDHVGIVCVLDQCLYEYNANDVVKTGRKFPKDVYKCFIQYNKVMEEMISGWGMFEGEYKTLCDNNFLGNIDNCVELCNNPVWALSRSQKITYLTDIVNDSYVQHRIAHYSGNVSEIEDLITPIVNKKPKNLLCVLRRRNTKDKIRQSSLGRKLLGIKRIFRCILHKE